MQLLKFCVEAGAQRPRLEEGLCPSQAFILLSGQGCMRWKYGTVSCPEPFFSSCPDGKGTTSTTSSCAGPTAGPQALPGALCPHPPSSRAPASAGQSPHPTPFPRAGPPPQPVYSLANSQLLRAQSWLPWGSSPNSGSWTRWGDGAVLLRAATRRAGLLLSPCQTESRQRLGLTFPPVLYF